MNSDNIDKIAFAFFSSLVACSILNDSYLVISNFIKNSYVKKKISYLKKIYKIFINLSFNNYKKDKNGNIIIDDKNIEKISNKLDKDNLINKISTNPFDDIENEHEDSEKKEIINSKIEDHIPINTTQNKLDNINKEEHIPINTTENKLDNINKEEHISINTNENKLELDNKEHRKFIDSLIENNLELDNKNLVKKKDKKIDKKIKEVIIKKQNKFKEFKK